MPNKEPNPWKIISATSIYNNNWIELMHYNVINPTGGKGIYGKVHFKNKAIGIIAIDNEENIYLVGQYRFPTDQYSWELPEGGCTIEEQPLDAAKRELLEEVGLEASYWETFLQMHLSNSVTDEEAIVFLAKELKQKVPCPEETELLKTKKLPFHKVFKMVMNGEITDSITVAAILKLKLSLL